jgi:hypothetical protein
MQQRIAEIIEKAKANAPQPGVTPEAAMVGQAPPPAPRPLSLMDHVIQLRQEVAALRQEQAQVSAQVAAASQVTEAVGGAVQQLYNMFFQQSEASTYSSSFQAQNTSVEEPTYDDY